MNRAIIGITFAISVLYHVQSMGEDTMLEIPTVRSAIVFSPHPDDDILGCGGTIIKHISEGTAVTIIYMTSGEAAYWPDGPTGLARLRENEASNAAKKIGVSDIIFLREPDGHLQQSKETVEKIITLLETYKPELIYTPHESDSHPDHIATYYIVNAAIKALISIDRSWKPVHLCYEVWTPLCRITHASNISQEMTLKLSALEEHRTQIKYMNFIAAVKALNRYRGIMAFTGLYGECFIKVDYTDDSIDKGE